MIRLVAPVIGRIDAPAVLATIAGVQAPTESAIVADGIGRPDVARRYRHPSDVARLVFAALVIAALLLLELLVPAALSTFSVDVVALVDGLPDAIADGIVGLVQFGAALAPLAVAAWLLLQRRISQLLIVAGAAAFAAVLMALLGDVIDDSIPIAELGYGQVNSWFIGSQYPSAALLAALTAIHVSLSPWLARS